MSICKKIAHCTQGNSRLNRKALCIKRSWDEVFAILNTCHPCCPKGGKNSHQPHRKC